MDEITPLDKGAGIMLGMTRKGIYETGKVLFLPVDAIVPNPDQPRKRFSQAELEELAGSIQALGVLQPLTVRRRSGGWELVAGERRLRAARLAGLSQVPCLSIQTDSQSSSLLALVENLQRKDLDFWEEAKALRRLIDTYSLSQEEVARRIGKSQSAVANKLRLLKLPEGVLEQMCQSGCTERHARALLRLEEPQDQVQAAAQVVERHLTVAQTEALVESMVARQQTARKKPTFLIRDVRLFLNTITRSLDLMRSAGVDAQCRRTDTDQEILLTIHIPRRPG
ncbi:ParB/RepB/Spo0J family partition protein [Pseudoflavonifractor sp. AF19-9AC]|uniref:ParB/RepB/Spo0J family partition protein n=1 Tax=Pseudoflavonifractor sp. AF19-9AC TaxID=2292244 RepID=UPI00242CB05F|nr:ParB/RepB/Spo0J family partition protein [Pseudoflavonifractor sp. AF19-9AC]